MKALYFLFGLVMIAALIAVQLFAFYLVAQLVLYVVSFVPLIGRKHRHKDFDQLNRRP
jgi:hypothetical protein